MSADNGSRARDTRKMRIACRPQGAVTEEPPVRTLAPHVQNGGVSSARAHFPKKPPRETLASHMQNGGVYSARIHLPRILARALHDLVAPGEGQGNACMHDVLMTFGNPSGCLSERVSALPVEPEVIYETGPKIPGPSTERTDYGSPSDKGKRRVGVVATQREGPAPSGSNVPDPLGAGAAKKATTRWSNSEHNLLQEKTA
ncbi:hypothetical protein BC826DRAFT_974584 [Russula brevipes]|nr:hypothetical protein BC826DRAFT_974584 [Russula brevipes]